MSRLNVSFSCEQCAYRFYTHGLDIEDNNGTSENKVIRKKV